MITLSVLYLAYSLFLYVEMPVREKPISETESSGKMLWQQYNCIACHQVYGLGGYLGPDLTNVYSLKGPAYIDAFLQSGTQVMPNFHLNPDQRKAIIDYLKIVDQSGTSDPRKFKIHLNGTIE